ncbi:MAG: ATP synthase subunit delta, sodium ion specific [Candidatus Omnitrophica bacterium]|nr:ATP synthase subunit delta, sodium ion specific [Candidatus Omnitrophota bacterium]
MRDVQVAERYARALFELAHQLGKDAAVEADLCAFAQAVRESDEVRRFLLNPYVKVEQKKQFVRTVWSKESDRQVASMLAGFVSVLLDKGRFALIQEIADLYKKIADASQGEGHAEVWTAAPLDADAEERIRKQVERYSGCKITLKKHIDPSILGGAVLKFRNKVFDGSVAGQLRRMKQELLQVKTF